MESLFGYKLENLSFDETKKKMIEFINKDKKAIITPILKR